MTNESQKKFDDGFIFFIFIPPATIPYSKRNRSKNFSECVIFYEHDIEFADIIHTPKDFVDDLLRFPAVMMPDNSFYCDSPLIVQIFIRGGDDSSYTTDFLPEKSGKENKFFFRAGLEAMLDELTPEVVMVYGRMPDSIFGGLKHKTNH